MGFYVRYKTYHVNSKKDVFKNIVKAHYKELPKRIPNFFKLLEDIIEHRNVIAHCGLNSTPEAIKANKKSRFNISYFKYLNDDKYKKVVAIGYTKEAITSITHTIGMLVAETGKLANSLK